MHHTFPCNTLPRNTLPRTTLPRINAPLPSPLLFLQALGNIDGKVVEYLLNPAVEDEIQLYSTPTFELELGIVDDGAGEVSDCSFGSTKELWGLGCTEQASR